MEKAGIAEHKEVPTTLDMLAWQTLDELMTTVFSANDPASAAAREQLVTETRERVEKLDAQDRRRLLQAVDADELNDAAIRTILLTGGGLGAFGMSVSAAGFSAYILAAQVSAFIPLVSGPALVSTVAVLSNPITIIAATAGVGWWATRSANQKIQAAIGIRVVSLLALSGLSACDAGVRQMLRAVGAWFAESAAVRRLE